MGPLAKVKPSKKSNDGKKNPSDGMELNLLTPAEIKAVLDRICRRAGQGQNYACSFCL